MRKNNNIIYLITYFYINIISLAYGFIRLDIGRFSKNDVLIWSALPLILYIIAALIVVKVQKGIVNAWIIFITLTYMYWFGQSLLFLLNLLPEFSEIKTYNLSSLCQALIYQTFGFGLMNLGALLYSIKNVNKYGDTFKGEKMGDRFVKESTNKVAGTMFVISAPVILLSLYKKVVVSITGGYLALYEGGISLISTLEEVLSMLFIPSLFLLLAANKNDKRVRRLLITIFSVYIIGFLMSGGRSVAMGLGLCLMLFYHKQINPYKGKRLIWPLIIGVLLIFLIPIIGELRGMNNRTINDLLQIIEYTVKENNVIVSTMNSMGFSLFPMVKTIEIVPNIQEYSYGLELCAAILAILPSRLTFGYSFASVAALPDWLRSTLNMDYGPGYSLIAESYYNFGWFGIVAMFFLGVIIQKCFTNKKVDDKRVLYDAEICIVLYFLTLVVRNSLALFFRNIFFGVLLPIIFINILSKSKKGSVGK